MAYAHADIETEDGRIRRGSTVPQDIPGYDELVEAGSIREEEYDAAVEAPEPPAELVIDGVVYRRATDTANAEDKNADK